MAMENLERIKANKKIGKLIQQHLDVVQTLLEFNVDKITSLCEETLIRMQRDGKIIFMGNGGSAADSQHLAAEFIGRFVRDRKPLPAIALTTDSSILTSIGNDFGFDRIFERQVTALARSNDVIIGISTSGNSLNVIEAIKQAKKQNIFTVGLLGGDGGRLAKLVDIPIVISSNITARIQEAHILIGHILCEFCDEHFAINNQ